MLFPFEKQGDSKLKVTGVLNRGHFSVFYSCKMYSSAIMDEMSELIFFVLNLGLDVWYTFDG